jgi:mannose-6-phosphate isomerase-like protein (cupin superfamily)
VLPLPSAILHAVIDETVHLNSHETVRLVRETRQELEVEATWAPSGGSPPPHLHPAQDERFEVLAGRLTATVEGSERSLGPRETLEIRRGTPHKMWNSGREPATALWRTRPAGRTAEWFRTVDRLCDGGTREPALPAMASALRSYSDVFQLAIGPQAARPIINTFLRILALADFHDRSAGGR